MAYARLMDAPYDDQATARPMGAHIFSAVFIACLCSAVAYNALVSHGTLVSADADFAAVNGAGTEFVVDGGEVPSRTVTLTYDPIVEAAQRELKLSGFYTGDVDGVAGRSTRRAIMIYQGQFSMVPTGEANEGLIDHIRYMRELEVATNSETTSSLGMAPAVARPRTATNPVAAPAARMPARTVRVAPARPPVAIRHSPALAVAPAPGDLEPAMQDALANLSKSAAGY